MDYDVQIVRSARDLEAIRPLWDVVPWEREEAESDHLVVRTRARGGEIFGIVVSRDGVPAAAVAGRIERRDFPTNVGYRVLYSPLVRLLQIVDGGVVAPDPSAIPTLVFALRSELRRGHLDALTVPYLPIDSELFRAFAVLGSPVERQKVRAEGLRRRLILPGSLDELLMSLSRKIRSGVRYDTKKLLNSCGDDLSVSVLREPTDFERLVRDLDTVAASTYHRALGAGFADTDEQRAVARVGLDRGWTRAYVLYRGSDPIAYWLCSVYRRTLLLRRTGFDPSFTKDRVGIYLLTRLIDDACADPDLDIVDFGQGDALYKRHFSNESWHESDLTVFAPTWRARRINLTRSAVLNTAKLVRSLLDASGLTENIRARWRRRLVRSS